MGSVDHKPSQNEKILAYIERFGSITAMEAMTDLGIMRLASRMSDLKSLGYPVTSTFETVTNRFGEKCHIKRYSISEGKNRNDQ